MPELITKRLRLKDANFADIESIKAKYGLTDEAEVVRKGYATKQGDKVVDDDERIIESYITTLALDRDGEVVLPGGGILSDYRDHPVVLFAHNSRELPIGKNIWIKADKKGLIGATQYAKTPEAERVYQYRRDGFPLAESIGFIVLDYVRQDDDEWVKTLDQWRKDAAKAFGKKPEREPHTIITKWLLLEYSDVSVPSNPAALEFVKAKGLIKPLADSGILKMDEDPPEEPEVEEEEQEEDESIEIDETIEIPEEPEEIEVDADDLKALIKKHSTKMAEIVIATRKGKVIEIN
ncbi:MAG: hypothetical protein JW984_15220 [Deltaproteobacteria bacterium]|uniref:HK97 family phage prohead protease n=1 Tax=Candidatus Zymogenus saltonus TaxID=2844893 RepID=A0A9D8PP25_9DELT|nr:hypothetical protein [Candidatus Zymogenus saltonus]